ncbi:HdeD family acid-resistance protein [Sabulicella glaciei]|uniref:Protease n=1 Tax=Sabulicella glaciei TaxID=2984948 RepID=A0ABT3NTQ7_9PROT|nr:protease [Roseococcus sp. MDT2-1-1]MCW8085543.1 protease [Roseococcus sp. MDT2-1-1]
MIRIMLLLLGHEVIQRRWPVLLAAGLAWLGLGAFIFVDAIDGWTLIPPHVFGYFMLPEAALSLIAAAGSKGAARRLRLAKSVALLVAAGLILSASPRTSFILALLLALGFLVDGVLRIASAHLIRFLGWRGAVAGGVLEILFAVAMLQPLPTWYAGTVGCMVGLLLALSGTGIIHAAMRIRRLPPGTPVSIALSQNPIANVLLPPVQPERTGGKSSLIVHVWTPTGTVSTPLHQRAVSRYIAAVDGSGTISTGHAALELAPDLYISHYPAVEIDRSRNAFAALLRATTDNDVPGRFLPGHAEEVAGWCAPTAQVVFYDFNALRLRAFWEAYRQDQTYNLTSRNCSSAVAGALDAALEGAFVSKRWPVISVLGALTNPELWAAGLIRQRAESMAWTPGLVLDYARAMSAVIDPPAALWHRLLRPSRAALRDV